MMLACTLLGALQRYYNLLLNAWTRKYHKQHSKGQLRIGNKKSKTHLHHLQACPRRCACTFPVTYPHVRMYTRSHTYLQCHTNVRVVCMGSFEDNCLCVCAYNYICLPSNWHGIHDTPYKTTAAYSACGPVC